MIKYRLLSLLFTALWAITIFFTNIAIMIKGWGIEPVSWGWIIGVPFALTMTYIVSSVLFTSTLERAMLKEQTGFLDFLSKIREASENSEDDQQ